jgi:hypothetical protein
MNISFQVTNRQVMWAAFLLLIPDTFFWYAQLGSSWFSPIESFTFLSSENYLLYSAIIYLLLFFTLFVKGDRVWKPYFMVFAAFYGIYRYLSVADTWNKEGTAAKTILNNLFIKFSDQWPLQLLSTIAMIMIIGLSINEFKKVNSIAKALWNRARVIPFESTFCRENDPAPESYDEQLRQKRLPMDREFSQKITGLVEAFAWVLLQHITKPKKHQND